LAIIDTERRPVRRRPRSRADIQRRTGLRVPGRDPVDYAAAAEQILGDQGFADRLSARAIEAASSYTWMSTAARLRRVYIDLSERMPVDCFA
jgi:glycosyltransferase involved in cell wall biosynthesis